MLFIVNPIAGSSSVRRRTFLERISDFELSHSVVVTGHSGHAKEIALKAVEEGEDIVVAVGGDGTVNEVASALVGTETALGLVPLGSGNGLAFHLGITIDRAFDVLRSCYRRTIDVGTVNGRYFFCTAGVGFDAVVANDYSMSGHRGLITYVGTAVHDWFRYKPKKYEISIDGVREEQEALLITIGNASQWGNNFKITPGASVCDGLLDITIVKPVSTFQALQMPGQLRQGSIDKNTNIISRKGNTIEINFEGQSVAHFDGECFKCEGNVNINVQEKTLKVIDGRKEI